MSSFCSSCGSPKNVDAKFCPACGKAANPAAESHSVVTASPNRSTKHPMSRRAKLVYALIALCLFAFFTVLFINHLPGGVHPIIAAQPEVAMATMYTGQTIEPQQIVAEVRGGKVVFPLTTLLSKKALAFEYQASTGKIPLLAYISAEGKLVTAVRICEPCNSSTFRIEGMELACGNCETRWKLNNLEGIQGSCQKYPPDPIPSTIVGDEVQIDIGILNKWKMRI